MDSIIYISKSITVNAKNISCLRKIQKSSGSVLSIHFIKGGIHSIEVLWDDVFDVVKDEYFPWDDDVVAERYKDLDG